MSPAEFWASTPREASWFVGAAAWRQEQDARLSITNAYYTAGLGKQNRLPQLESLLPRSRKKSKALTPEQEWARWEAWATAVNATPKN